MCVVGELVSPLFSSWHFSTCLLVCRRSFIPVFLQSFIFFMCEFFLVFLPACLPVFLVSSFTSRRIKLILQLVMEGSLYGKRVEGTRRSWRQFVKPGVQCYLTEDRLE